MMNIYNDVLKAMQQAEELEGLSFSEYITLMNMIAQEATIRAKNAMNLSREILK